MCFWICGIWWTGPRGQMCLGRAGGTWASRRDASEGVSQKFSGRLERSQQVLGLLGQPGVAFSDWLHSTSPLILADLHQTNGESRSNNGAGTAAKRDGGPRLLRGSDGISGFSAQEDHPVLCRSHPSPSLLAVTRRKDRKKERARVMCTVAASVPNAFYTFHINYCGRSVCQGRSWSALESQAPPFFVNMRKNKIKNITSKH